MRRIGLVVYVIVSCCVIPAAAQGHWRELGDVTRVEKLANRVMLTAGSARVSVTVVNGNGTVRVHAVSATAREKIEAAGGTVDLLRPPKRKKPAERPLQQPVAKEEEPEG